MIPKIIHYCWFGGNPLPEPAQKCLTSWRKFLPDYEIKEWNENDYDVRKIPYVAQAYEAKKYAFVSDYARFDILYRYGGIYFDTDVEVIKPLDDILERGAFAGVECAGALNAGLGIASPAASPIYKEILDSYEKSNFLKQDGTQDLTTVVTRVSDIFRKHGFTDKDEIQTVAGITIYPTEYFCPKSLETGIIRITKNTYTIHHYDGSWTSKAQKKYDGKRKKHYAQFGCHIGKFVSLGAFIQWQITDNGFFGFCRKIIRKLK
ncbi:glycosyltransferase family 32 protein [Treponema brennaborense]|uniref:Glycosyltransferase sugar-binding region containing DXD motif n=1 Tax=Treponema brennaborense (strain DSM 12168 / CIP 105900 / DD5/3) TaxID=906968 RepID=F4LK08_TREBD|nr:glycosyltransferase [Treponema brennaborense]AEE17470.1 glycosyltransferase sugar-binding region containing DXD motif [Treponema brennaborense DSM 12168]